MVQGCGGEFDDEFAAFDCGWGDLFLDDGIVYLARFAGFAVDGLEEDCFWHCECSFMRCVDQLMS